MYVNWGDAFWLYYAGVLLLAMHYSSVLCVECLDPDGEKVLHWIPSAALILLWPAIVIAALLIVVFMTLDNFDEAFKHWRRGRQQPKDDAEPGHNNQTS